MAKVKFKKKDAENLPVMSVKSNFNYAQLNFYKKALRISLILHAITALLLTISVK